ncbi:hypothetical protein ASG88_17650 [Nocardioides sp. Soil777]|nr:hypothetical protein ASG88_17650 [Nocardioides sp. Soil777]
MLPGLRVGHRVIEIDLSGHGESEHRSAYSLAGWVGELVSVLLHAGAGPATLVGHSMGGKVCVVTAAARPDLVAGLVLFDVGLPPPARWRRRPPTMEGRQRRYPSRQELIERFVLTPPQPDPPAGVLAAIAAGSVRRDAAGWTWKHDRHSVPILDDREVGEAALRLDCRIAFVHAEHSHAVDGSVLCHVQSGLPAPVAVHCLPGTHHHLVLEVPDECARLVADFTAAL